MNIKSLILNLLRMADTINPKNPPIQDLQINLEQAPKITEWNGDIPQIGGENRGQVPTELNLDLDLNLPDAPKDDDRLKAEDQKNQEIAKQNDPIPQIETASTPIVVPVITQPVIEQLFQGTPAPQANESVISETVSTESVIEPIQETPTIEEAPVPVVPVINEPAAEEAIEHTQPGIMTEEVVVPATATSELNDDMKMIEDMEWHASAGGLAPEAMIDTQALPVEETPKTFDLDAMLGSPTIVTTPPTEVLPDRGENERGVTTQPIQTTAQGGVAPIPTPWFTIPTSTAQIATGQTTAQQLYTPIPHKKNTTVKVILFVLMFIALGATTFFILKTMYPLEFAGIFGGGQTQTEEILPLELTWSELTWTETVSTGTELSWMDMTGTSETETGAHGSATGTDVFWELDGLGAEPEPQQPIQNDVSRLTDYATQGNEFVEQGKKLTNNTMIKYGLFISKKSTAFLEDIANGKEINNLSGYFAQFDEYLVQLKELAGQTTDSTGIQTWVSPTPLANDIQGMTPDTGTTQNTWIAPE